MRRFFIPTPASLATPLTLDQEQSRHINRVLRLARGEKIILFDGQGNEFNATLLEVGKKVTVEISQHHRVEAVPPIIHLHQALLKGKKIEFIIQKMTELGIDYFHPFVSSHTAAKPPKAARLERWQKISLESCKQCGRARMMRVNPPTPLSEAVTRVDPAQALLFWEEEDERTIGELNDLEQRDELHIFIGPEGGFAREEVKLFQQRGIPTLSMGPFIMKADTAALCAVTLVLHQAGRLQPRGAE